MLFRAVRPQGFQLLSRQLVCLLLFECRNKVGVKAGQHVERGLAVGVHEHSAGEGIHVATQKCPSQYGRVRSGDGSPSMRLENDHLGAGSSLPLQGRGGGSGSHERFLGSRRSGLGGLQDGFRSCAAKPSRRRDRDGRPNRASGCSRPGRKSSKCRDWRGLTKSFCPRYYPADGNADEGWRG